MSPWYLLRKWIDQHPESLGYELSIGGKKGDYYIAPTYRGEWLRKDAYALVAEYYVGRGANLTAAAADLAEQLLTIDEDKK